MITAARVRRLRAVALPPAVFLGALTLAVAGARLTGPAPGGVNTGVEALSSSAGGLLGDISTVIPLGFAFGAGMVAAVNPCGFPLLPVYLGLYLRGGGGADPQPGASRRLGQALAVSGTVTAGFVILFAAAGVAIALGARVLATAFPWVGLGAGIAMIAAGAWLLGGGTLYSPLGEAIGGRIGDPLRADTRGYFLFGVSYGVASLSCTLPIFLSVAGGSVAANGLLIALGRFILYGLGMGAVIVALTVSMALFKAGLLDRMRRSRRYVEPAGGMLALAAGVYITYYWLTLGGLLDALT